MQEINKIFIKVIHYIKIFILFLFLVAIISHHFDDPSFSVATNKKAENILGNFGSYISDIFIQFLGIFAYFLPFIFALNSILFFCKKRFHLKYKYILLSCIFGLGVLYRFSDTKSGIVGFLFNDAWFFLPEKFSFIGNAIFSIIFFIIFIKINLHEIKNSKNKKKKKIVYNNSNLIIKSMFVSLRDFFLNISRKISKILYKKYSIIDFDEYKTPHFKQENSIAKEKSDVNTNLYSSSKSSASGASTSQSKVIYNPNVRNENRQHLNIKQKFSTNTIQEEKNISLGKGEIEYQREGEEVKKTPVSYNHKILHTAPKIFENEKNQKLYEELQARRVSEMDKRKVFSNILENLNESKQDHDIINQSYSESCNIVLDNNASKSIFDSNIYNTNREDTFLDRSLKESEDNAENLDESRNFELEDDAGSFLFLG